MSKIEVDAIEPQSGTTLTIGASGDTINIPAGVTLTGAGLGLAWQSVQTTGFTASAGNAYPCNTTSASFTVTLPATPSAGDQVQLVDYAGTFDTNALTIDPNGEDIEGGAFNLQLTGEREGVILTYIDSTQGWIATSGINEGTDALSPAPYSVDFLVIAGGGGAAGAFGASGNSGGGGAGGYRTSTQTVNFGTVITVTVGDGGAGNLGNANGNAGSNSSISGSGLTTITSAGGGRGALHGSAGGSGGSGGGGSNFSAAGGSGNTPSTSPSQGNNGGTGAAYGTSTGTGGGGGANAVGNNAVTTTGGNGGAGTASSITGSSITRAGGGGGSGSTAGTGGVGGGGNGTHLGNGISGTVNTGGGGGGTSTLSSVNRTGGSGGKGVVILSMPLARFSGTVTGSPTESDDGTTKVLIFNGSGSYTA
jgi:hypothetical protein